MSYSSREICKSTTVVGLYRINPVYICVYMYIAICAHTLSLDSPFTETQFSHPRFESTLRNVIQGTFMVFRKVTLQRLLQFYALESWSACWRQKTCNLRIWRHSIPTYTWYSQPSHELLFRIWHCIPTWKCKLTLKRRKNKSIKNISLRWRSL